VSDLPFDPSGQGGDQPSEEEIREYLGQLRAAPVEQVVAEVASAVLNAAQVKLGRQDGRVLIDVLGAVTEQVRGRLPAELTDQLEQALTQLRMAQVDAERQVQQAATQGHREEGDLPGEGEPAADEAASDEDDTEAPQRQAPPQAAARPGSDPASRLWVPGR
jgi:hypothetical protein